MPIRTYRWDLSLSHGLHINGVVLDFPRATLSQIVLGLATEIAADFYFSGNFYLNASVVLTYDFYSFGDSTIATARGRIHDDRHGATAYISCHPKIAIGYRMM